MTPEFKDVLVEGMESAPKKAKKPEIEGVLEWIARLIAAKDAEGVVALIDAAGTDESKLEIAVSKVKDLAKDSKADELSELETLLDDIPGNKDTIVEKIKILATGNALDPGTQIIGATNEISNSYKSLVDWLQSGATDDGRRMLELRIIRDLDEQSLERLKERVDAAVLVGKKIDKNKVALVMREIRKQKIEKRETRRILGNEDAEMINEQARRIRDKIDTRTKNGSITSKAEGFADQRHLLESLKIMGRIKQESEASNVSWDEYIASDKVSSIDKQLLIAGMEVIRREVGPELDSYEEIYVFMKQVRDSWNDKSLSEASEARQKYLVERYGSSKYPSQNEERLMPQRATEKYLRDHPELLSQWPEFADFNDMLLDPDSDIQEYMKRNKMGLNIDYSILKNDQDDLMVALRAAGLEDIIDLEAMESKGVPALRKDGFTSEQRKQAENIILQELLKAVRVLVAEGVEGNTMMYDPRATRYFTLLTISGVSTDLKQTVGAHMKLHYLEYMWRNGYVDEEVYGRLIKFYSEQGPEYRLHEALKIREGFVLEGIEGDVNIGEFNFYDFEKYLTRNVSAADKAHFGMPSDVDRTYATALATKVTPEAMARDRMTFLKSMLKQHWGEDKYNTMIAKFKSESDFLEKFMGVEGKYNDYIHKSYIYWIGNGRLGEVVGNGNLKSNASFELAQGVPEYYYKRDPRLMVMFLWVYKPQLVPDVLAPIMRMGITSLGSMYGEEIATHLISLKDTPQGARGINTTFFKDGRAEHAEAWRMMWEDSLYDYDEYHEHGHGHHESIYFEKSSSKRPKDGHDALTSRRTNEDTIMRLKGWMAQYDVQLGQNFYNSIDWGWAKEKFKHNKELVAYLNEEHSGREKMNYFVNHFGDDYFVTDGLKSKRGDNWMKYMGKYQDEFFKAAVEYATNPEVETMAKLVGIVNSIVGVGKVGPFRERMREVLYYMSKSRMTGEKFDLFKVDDEGRIVFDANRWVGSNQGEFPLPQIESVMSLPSMNMNKKSALAYRGLEGKVYEPLLERIMLRDMRANNAFPDIKAYNKAVNKWRFGLLWEKDRSAALNVLSLLTGRSLSEFIAVGLFEMPPHVFWEWVFENTEKSWETTLKVFEGGGHH